MSPAYRKLNKNSGFSLVELLVVLVIIVALASIVAPNLVQNNESNDLQQASKTLAYQIQLTINDSRWLRLNHGVSIKDESIVIEVQRNGEWLVAKTLDIPYSIAIEVDHHLLSSAAKNIDAKSNHEILIFSNGEYTPFELAMASGSYKATMEGDGFNAIKE